MNRNLRILDQIGEHALVVPLSTAYYAATPPGNPYLCFEYAVCTMAGGAQSVLA